MYEFKSLRIAGPGSVTPERRNELGAQGWYPLFTFLGVFAMWMRRTGGGGGAADLTEILNRLDGLDIAIDVIGQTFDHMQKEIDELKQGGNGHIPTYSFEFDVWCMRPEDGNIAKSGAIIGKYGFIDGDELTARFSIKVGGSVSDGIFYIVPQTEAQPTGYAPFFLGTATKHSKKEGWMLDGIAYWHRRNEFGSGKQGIRLQFPTFNPVMGYPHHQDHEYYRPGGALYAGKTGIGGDPWSPDGEDTYEVTIHLP